MKRDKGFTIISALFLLNVVAIHYTTWRFTGTFASPRFTQEVLARQTDVPEITRKFAHDVAKHETETLKFGVGYLVKGSLLALTGTSLFAFLFLAYRQHRLTERIEKLEAERRAD